MSLHSTASACTPCSTLRTCKCEKQPSQPIFQPVEQQARAPNAYQEGQEEKCQEEGQVRLEVNSQRGKAGEVQENCAAQPKDIDGGEVDEAAAWQQEVRGSICSCKTKRLFVRTARQSPAVFV